MADLQYDFSGQEELTDLAESINPDYQDQTQTKKKPEQEYNFSAQEELFPKDRQQIAAPKQKITSKFGKRQDPFGLGTKFHNGVDIPMPLDTPVNSLGRGTIIETGDSGSKNYGRYVDVDYGGGLVLRFGHLNKIGVEIGDRVSPEALIGLSGSTGRSKSPHLHIRALLNGKPVNPQAFFGGMHNVAIGLLSNDDITSDKKYDFSGQENITSSPDYDKNLVESTDTSQFNFKGQDQIGEVKPIVEEPYVDRRTLAEIEASGAAALFQPKITVANPNQLTGDRIVTNIPAINGRRPDINTITDYWLASKDPQYARINQEYRSMTGNNLIHFDGEARFIGDNTYQLSARWSKGATDLVNAYIQGRDKGGPEAGWEAAYFKSQEIKRQNQAVKDEVDRFRAERAKTLAQRHPYLAKIVNIAAPIFGESLLDQNTLNAGISNAIMADAQLMHNLRMLPEALYTLYRYGGDSQEYNDLIERDREIQKNLSGYQSEIYQPKTIPGKIVSGAITGGVAFPKYALAGTAGVSGLPLLVYVENLHRGNREAALAALPMSLMSGFSHGFGEYLNSGTKFYLNTIDENGNPVNVVKELGRGLGNRAPFTRLQQELSINPNIQSAFLAKESASLASLSPLERQLVLRGSNALLGAGSLALEGGSLEDVAANFVVGLTFPVGRTKVGSYSERLLPPVDSPTRAEQMQFLPEAPRVAVPLTGAPKYGESKLPIIEQQREVPPVSYPTAESPDVLKYAPIREGQRDISDPLHYQAQTEKGFKARGQGQTLYLNLDTAALNLLDLRRALTEKTFATGDIKETTNRQAAIQKAIRVLESQIPPELLKYFEDNEATIRAALKSNWNAIRAKEEYLGNQTQTPEIKTPDEVKNNPNIEVEGSAIERLKAGLVSVAQSNRSPEIVREIAKDVFGNAGEQNRFITPDRALLAYDRFLNIKGKSGTTLKSAGPQDLAAIGRELVEGSKAIAYLTQIAAFHLEDFYHRKTEPSFVEFKNRMILTLGEAVKGFSDKDFQTIFQSGQQYLASNVADPFFSKMKQDAMEKLPNKFTAEQARNILSQHKDEFEWTSGLQGFLNEAEKNGKKISKSELIDFIQRNQVRVEESVAEEIETDSREWAIQNRRSQIEQRQDAIYRAQQLGHYDYPPVRDIQDQINELNQQQSRVYAGRFENQDEYARLENEIQRLEEKKLQVIRGSAPEFNRQVHALAIEEGKLVAEDRELAVEQQRIEKSLPIYSLKRYEGGEKLELPGAEGSKEVKLISPIILRGREAVEKFGLYDDEAYRQEEAKIKYRSPHWQGLMNVISHYRSSVRKTIDGLRTYFGEEFQSDWNHDIRERGLKREPISFEKFPEEYVVEPVENPTPEGDRFKVRNTYNNIIVGSGRTPEAAKHDAVYFHNRNIGEGIEPNPFMQHNWKELTLKRFLRDAAIAKDKNGNYLYDGVGWTTARQQMERYGKILEGKEFKWKKNSDGTYSFSLRTGEGGEWLAEGETQTGWNDGIHELQNISLERFAELTTPEAAQEVRDQEASRGFWTKRDMRRLRTLDKIYQDPNEREAYHNRNLMEERFELINKRSRSIEAPTSGQFSLKEAVELRKGGMDKYGDYDTAYKNILNKIAKRFGAKYSEKEIPTGNQESKTTVNDSIDIQIAEAAGQKIYNANDNVVADPYTALREGADLYTIEKHPKTEKIHYLEITPSMRKSLEMEGFSLYGLGGSESLRAQEQGIRNKIVTVDAFNEARNDLVKRIEEFHTKDLPDRYFDSTEQEQRILDASKEDAEAMQLMIAERRARLNNTFNSGLNPDALIDQITLAYHGIKDLAQFTEALVRRYGEAIRDFAEDFYWTVKGKASEFNSKLNISIDNWQADLNKVANDPAWQMRQGEHGKFSLRKRSPELEEYFKDQSKHQKSIYLDYRAWLRGTALAQLSTEFGKVYDSMRLAQRVVHSYESNILTQLMLAKRIKKGGMDKQVAEAIYAGNEWINPATGKHEGKVFTDPELAGMGLNSNQILAYRNIRAAVDNVLNLRLESKLYGFREKANKLNAQLTLATPGSAEEARLKTELLDLSDAMNKMSSYYQRLKDTGYITIQRRGKVAAFIEDPSYPVGDPKRKIYNQFESRKEADKWLQAQKTALGIPLSTKAGEIYDIVNLKDIALKEKLTPSQFEDLVDRSGADTNDPEIEKIRAEVYSKFPSFTYQLEREFVRGYDRDLQTAIDSITHQTELYASSFYSKVGLEEGMKALEATGIEKTDPNLYRIASQYIKDEVAPAPLDWVSKGAVTARRFTYLWQLGFDVNQLYLNAVAQPITQTFGYFSRIEHNGIRLTGLEPEQYWIRAWKLTNNDLVNRTKARFGGVPKVLDPAFEAIKQQLASEHVLTPEFTKTYLESKAGTGKISKGEHWASVFMRSGEQITRTHAAAEAYLVGTEKFGLTGDELIKFIVRAVGATQSNPTRGENPFVVRQAGEVGKLFYQFVAFNQMWWENLALGAIASKGGTPRKFFGTGEKRFLTTRELPQRAVFVSRELAPLAIMGGITGLPLSAFAATMYTLITGKDPKKEMDKILGDDSYIEKLTRYGITAGTGVEASMSQKLTPDAPLLDSAGNIINAASTFKTGDIVDNIPFFATADQIVQGRMILRKGKRLKGVEALLPRAPRGIVKAAEAGGLPFGLLKPRGFRSASGDILLSRNKQTPVQIIGQAINISPTPVLEKYEREKTRTLKRNKTFKKLRRAFK